MKITSKHFIVLLTLFTVLPITTYAACTPKINRNLKLGSSGVDVKTLQKFLNDSPDTKIATTGVNSKGKENGVFDKATQKAFMIFQKNNFNTILKPAKLTAPNGFVGVNARKIINTALCEDIGTTPPALNASSTFDAKVSETLKNLDSAKQDIAAITKKLTDLTSKFTSTSDKINEFVQGGVNSDSYVNTVSKEITKRFSGEEFKNKVIILGTYPPVINVGDSIFILGLNFGSTNKIYIGKNSYVVNKTISTDNFVTFKLPTNIVAGNYDIYIENSLGKSDPIKIKIEQIESEEVGAPTITTITPNHGNVGTEVMITGKNFTKSNTIYTTTKIFSNVASTDGKTLKFKLSADELMLDKSGKLFPTLPFMLYVSNSNGDSEAVNFKLE